LTHKTFFLSFCFHCSCFCWLRLRVSTLGRCVEWLVGDRVHLTVSFSHPSLPVYRNCSMCFFEPLVFMGAICGGGQGNFLRYDAFTCCLRISVDPQDFFPLPWFYCSFPSDCVCEFQRVWRARGAVGLLCLFLFWLVFGQRINGLTD